MGSSARLMLVAALAVAVAVASVTAQATTAHSKGRLPQAPACEVTSLTLALTFSAVSSDRIVPATADVKTAAIATPIVRSFNIHLDGQPDVIVGAATTNAIIMDQPGGDIRITNVFIHNKFAGDKYNGWLISSGNLIYDFSKPAAAVRGDATVTGGSGSFAGASGTLTTEIISGVGTATAKLQIPNRHCYAAQGGSAFPK